MGLGLARQLPEREQNGMHSTVDLTDGKKPSVDGSLDKMPQRTPALGDLAQAIKENFFLGSLSSIRTFCVCAIY